MGAAIHGRLRLVDEPDTERYLLQIDRQTKRSFKTPEAAQAMSLEVKARFPIL